MKNYFVKAPRKDRASWSIVGYVIINDKRQYFTTSESIKSNLISINTQYKKKTLSYYDAKRQVYDLVDKLYRSENNVTQIFKRQRLSEDNHKILETYWNEVYGAKELEDASSMRYDLLRSLKLIEPLSILTASASEMREALRINRKNIIQHRRAVDRLNQLLSYLKRDIRLEKPKAGIKRIKYVTKDELIQILKNTDDITLKHLYMTLFGTGMRLGESMAISIQDIKSDGCIIVDKQITQRNILKLPKREKTGEIVSFSFCLNDIKAWARVSDKQQYRTIAQKTLKKICRKIFPDNPEKHLSIHDLRHSHAIHLLSLGASLTMIALNLRNRVEVCQKYYTGFSHTNETLVHLMEVIKQK